MNTTRHTRFAARGILVLAASALALAGCPPDPDDYPGTLGQVEYDAGFAAGFAQDAEYWKGYDDSYDTVDFGPIYYQGSSIPFVESPPYEAGYWDGVWYAYNDGYFVAYDYAFTIGFSEGYAITFGPDWEAFLANDEHIEYADGGFSDGYNDGFTEGSILGAADYLDGFASDWLDAMMFYRDGNDVEIVGLGLATGEIYLYEYGTDPNDLLKAARPARRDRPVPSIRQRGPAKAEVPALSFRALSTERRADLNVVPSLTPRSDRELALTSTWLERVDAYLAALEQPARKRITGD